MNNSHSRFVPFFIILAMPFEVHSESLIDLIKESGCPWDLTSDTYKDKQERVKAWTEMGERLVENYMDHSDKNKAEQET